MGPEQSDPGGSAKVGSDSTPSDSLRYDGRQRLADAIDEAGLLVWFASKRGIGDVDTTTIEVITNANEKFSSDNLSAAEESLFWDSYRALARLVAPVTVESIRASYGLGAAREDSARKAIRVYSSSTLIVLIFLVFLQAYWFVGTSVTADIENIRDTIQELATDRILVNHRAEAEREKEQADRNSLDIKIKEIEEIGSNNESEKVLAIRSEIAGLKLTANESKLRMVESLAQLQNIDYRHELNKHKLTGNYQIIDAWDFYSEIIHENLENTVGSNTAVQRPRLTDAQFNKLTEAGKEEYRKRIIAEDTARENRERLRIDAENRVREIFLLTTKSVLAVFNQYLLPLLYGLLGSLAYILRTLTREIQEVTYTRGSNVRYQLRWPLGVLAGVSIGWFFDSGTLSGVATITPLGLAFLAGYSVELLFAGLDRIVGAFTGPRGGASGAGT